jgi:hypothetical protein
MIEVKDIPVSLSTVHARVSAQVLGQPVALLLLVASVVGAYPDTLGLSFCWIVSEVTLHVFAMIGAPSVRVFEWHVFMIPAYESHRVTPDGSDPSS